jgi:predicted CXXCH cytochrome family protein
MRTRTAKKLAQRIDLNYFKRPHGLRRVRMLLSIAAPALGLLWLGSMAMAGSRAPYSSGPVSSAHAFAEMKCEACHQRDDSFRAHVTDNACLTCHAGPSHPPSPPSGASARQAAPVRGPACVTCHREHQGRVRLAAAVPDGMCVECHGDLPAGSGSIARSVGAFPSDHPEFGVLREGKDPGTVRFNHEVHVKNDLRGPNGPETLECTTCHQPKLSRTGGGGTRVDNLMASVTFDRQCARCHPLFFDARIEQAAPHAHAKVVWPFVDQALRDYINANPRAITERDQPDRRLPLNFPREPEPVAKNADEWVQKRAIRAKNYLARACAYCHGNPTGDSPVDRTTGPPVYQPANLRTEWMARATFDHGPHLMVECSSCHKAENSRATADVLMPSKDTCATCHAPGKWASSQCIECHGYHDWSKAQPVKPHFKLTDFQ